MCVYVCLEVLGDGLWICVLKCNVSYSLKVMWAKTGKKTINTVKRGVNIQPGHKMRQDFINMFANKIIL